MSRRDEFLPEGDKGSDQEVPLSPSIRPESERCRGKEHDREAENQRSRLSEACSARADGHGESWIA